MQQWKRFCGLGLESVWANLVPATTWLRFFGDDSLKMVPNILSLDGTEETRSRVEIGEGDYVAEGDLSDIELIPGNVPVIFEWAFGTAAGNVYTLKDGVMPSATIEFMRGGTQAYRYRGMKVNSMSMSATVREVLKLNLSLVGEREEKLAAPTARSYDAHQPFIFYQGLFKVDTDEVEIQEMSFDLNNALRHPNFRSGDRYTKEQTEGVREVTGSFRIVFSSTTLYEKILAYTSAALCYKFTDPGTSAALQLDFPKVYFETPEFDRGDQDYDLNINFVALKDGADKEVKATYTP